MIDPALIKSADLFKTVVMKYPLEKRLEIGSPVQYFLEHTPEERFNQLSRLTGYSDNVLRFLLKVGNIGAIDKYEELRLILPEEFASNPFIFTHVLSEQLPMDLLQAYPQLINYLPALAELNVGKYSNLELHGLGQSARRMFLTYALFTELKIDTDCFKYFKQSTDFEESLNSIGYSSKAILKVIIQRSREFYGTEGFLDEVLDIKYLNNYIDPKKVIRAILGEMRRSKMQTIVLRTIWSVIGSFMAIEGVPAYGGISAIFRFYLWRYKRWTDHSDVVIMDDGAEFYSHRHTMLSTFNRCLAKKDSPWQDWVKLPESIDTPPGELFADFIQAYAKQQYRNLIKEHGSVVFKDMNDKFKYLNPDKYRYINNAVDLVIEGRNMSHCVGGENYISECATGHTCILHYNDGVDRHGYTIELSGNVTFEDQQDLLFTGYDEKAKWWKGYRVFQIKGYDNNEPSNQVKLDILLDLINASIQFREVPENEVKREMHKYRLCMKNQHWVLRDHTTRIYHIADVINEYIPFKSSEAKEANWRLLNPRLVYRYGMKLTGRPERIPGEHEHRMHQLLHDARFPAGIAGDFEGDVINGLAAQIMEGRMRGMHDRRPDLNRGWFDGMREHAADMDLEHLYPHQQQLLSAKHLGERSFIKDSSVALGITNVPLFELTKATQTRNIGKSLTYPQVTIRAGFKYNTGREYLIGQALHSLGKLYGSWWQIDGKLPLMADLGMRLLANKIRYGFMSEEEIVKNIFLISDHGYNLFCSEVSVLSKGTTGSIRKNGHRMVTGGRMYTVTSTIAPYIPSMAILDSDSEVIFDYTESIDMWHAFNNVKVKTNNLGFDFNDKFSRNILGRYGVRFN